MPRTNVRQALPNLIPGLHEDRVEAGIPREESHIRKGHLVADEPLGISGLGGQHALNDAQDAPDLAVVALDGGRDLLRVQVSEPAGLAEVRALPAHLEVQELVAEVPLLQGAVRDAVGGGVVLLDYVLVDGARLPERDARVGVLDRGDTPIWVDVYEGLLLDVVEAE